MIWLNNFTFNDNFHHCFFSSIRLINNQINLIMNHSLNWMPLRDTWKTIMNKKKSTDISMIFSSGCVGVWWLRFFFHFFHRSIVNHQYNDFIYSSVCVIIQPFIFFSFVLMNNFQKSILMMKNCDRLIFSFIIATMTRDVFGI